MSGKRRTSREQSELSDSVLCGLATGRPNVKAAKIIRPALEACGIDVYTTARRAGFPIEVVRTRPQCPEYYGLVLID